jgi:glycine/D-amino acid oxidase-like deaminating enzyme
LSSYQTTVKNDELTAQKVVFATGYETQRCLKQKLVALHSSYALVSEPVDLVATLGSHYLLWETDRLYFYLRTTADNRLLMGGADLPFRNPIARDKLIDKKQRELLADFQCFYLPLRAVILLLPFRPVTPLLYPIQNDNRRFAQRMSH